MGTFGTSCEKGAHIRASSPVSWLCGANPTNRGVCSFDLNTEVQVGYFSLWVDVLSKFSLYTLAALPHILFGRRETAVRGAACPSPPLVCCYSAVAPGAEANSFQERHGAPLLLLLVQSADRRLFGANKGSCTTPNTGSRTRGIGGSKDRLMDNRQRRSP